MQKIRSERTKKMKLLKQLKKQIFENKSILKQTRKKLLRKFICRPTEKTNHTKNQKN